MAAPYNQTGYGLSQALIGIFPSPRISNRTPTTADKLEVGRLWVQPKTTAGVAANRAWIETSIINNSANWLELVASGGAGVFSSLLVTPGPTSITGSFTLIAGTNAVSIGADAADHATTIGSLTGSSAMLLQNGTGGFIIDGVGSSIYAIGPSTTTGLILIGGVAQTGTITLGNSTAAQTVTIAAGATGVKTLNLANDSTANIISIGNTQTGGSISLGSAMTTGTIAIGSATSGLVTMPPVVVTAAGTTVINSVRVGQAVYTGNVTGAAATVVLTLTNTLITATSSLMISVANLGANDAQMTIQRIQPGAGTCAITLKNNGAAALNGNIAVDFWVRN